MKRRVPVLWPLLLIITIVIVEIRFDMLKRSSKEGSFYQYMSVLKYFAHTSQIEKNKETEPYELSDKILKYVKQIQFTRMKFGPVYVFGTTVGNSSELASWDLVKVYASVNKIFSKSNVSCCLQYYNGKRTQPILSYTRPNPETELTTYHYTCLNPKPGTIPLGVALTLDNFTCENDHVVYRTPTAPREEAGTKLALCTKAAYGNRSAELIIEWMEAYKFLGVDKIVGYYLKDLNQDARKVLIYYASTGLLDLYYFEPAEPVKVYRSFHPPDEQFANDKQLLVFDSFERMSGYSYFGIIDYDEFLIPPNGKNLKTYLADLYQKYKNTNSAGFTFRTLHFYLNMGQYGTENDLILGRYITRPVTGPQLHSEKNLYKPKFILPGEIHTHAVKPVPGFHMLKLQADEGYIRHYRECYTTNCVGLSLRKNDTSAALWSKRIENNVKAVRQKIFGSQNSI